VKPKGLVLAASMTSRTSMPMRSKVTLSSLTRAMFTERKTFSNSLALAATRALETGTTRSTAAEQSARAASVEGASTPPITFGMLLVLKPGLPGSSCSGEKASR